MRATARRSGGRRLLLPGLVLAVTALVLAACVGVAPIELSDYNPASPKAPSDFVASPEALDDYKSAQDLAARAQEDAKAPAMSQMDHGGMNMPGMSMPGMQMPSGNAPRQGGAGADGTTAPHVH